MDYKYCPKCANRLTKKAENLFVCKNCGFHLYENPRPTNGLIAENDKGEILLVKRLHDPKKGYWDVAGGFVDFEETAEESIKREVKEELGVDLTDLRYFTSTADRYLYKGINYHTLCFFFIATISNPKHLKASDDISEMKFFPKDQIPYKKIAFEGVKLAIKKYVTSS